MAMCVGYGGYEVVHHNLTLGGLVASYTYVARLFDPLSAAVDADTRFIRVSASIRRITRVLNEVRG